MQMCGDMKVDACGPAIASCSCVCVRMCVYVCVYVCECVCVYYRCTTPYAQEILKMFMCDAPNCSKYM